MKLCFALAATLMLCACGDEPEGDISAPERAHVSSHQAEAELADEEAEQPAAQPATDRRGNGNNPK